MLEIFKNPIFWGVLCFFIIAIILILCSAAGKLGNIELKAGDNSLKIDKSDKKSKEQERQEKFELARKARADKQEKERLDQQQKVMGLVLSISSEEIKLGERIVEIKEECLSSQLKFAKRKMTGLKNEIYEEYRKLDADNRAGVQLFGLLFDRDFGDIAGTVYDTIRENHLAEKSEKDFEEYLKVTCEDETNKLKRKCHDYVDPINIEYIDKIINDKIGSIYDSIDTSLRNAQKQSAEKFSKIEEAREESIRNKKISIKNFFPEIDVESLDLKTK